MESWSHCTNLLVIRPDNIGDVLMSSPAIRAIKRCLGSKITLLTSAAGAAASALLPEVDDTVVANVPWVKQPTSVNPREFLELAELLKARQFDGCIVFTVYSQNPLPSAMLAWMAGIPKRLAYCRENPYDLLTHWIPDDEPYSRIRHQVARDLDLVEQIGAYTNDDRITIAIPAGADIRAMAKLAGAGVDLEAPYMILHAGVSEFKREFPVNKWVAIARRLLAARPEQLVFTGNAQEAKLTDYLRDACGGRTFSIAGLLDITEFAAVIRQAALVVSVNTATIHLAAALGRPAVVLYALTNPQHTPWRSPHVLFPYSVADGQAQSRNEVIRYVNQSMFEKKVEPPATNDVLSAVNELLKGHGEGQPIYQGFFN